MGPHGANTGPSFPGRAAARYHSTAANTCQRAGRGAGETVKGGIQASACAGG